MCGVRVSLTTDAGYFEAKAVAKLVDKRVKGRAIGFGNNMAFVGIISAVLLDELFMRRPAGVEPTF